ncbi:hypothetical protein IJS77_01915 [bacterium]|nr:hypothetical protein [bacterium]
MAKVKSKNELSVLEVVFNGLKTYLFNLDIFVRYLSFPVLGTFLGAFLLFVINYCFVTNLEKLQASNPIFQNMTIVFTLLLVLTIPGFLIMIKAFVDYIIAFGAINSMCVLGEKRIIDVFDHNEIIKRRFAPYCVLIFVLSIILGFLSFPLFIPVMIIALVFLSLAVQVFTLEENASPFDALGRSIQLVKSRFWLVFFVMILIFLISYIICPYLITWAISKTPLLSILANPVEKYISLLPVAEINTTLSELQLPYKFDTIIFAESIVNTCLMTIVTMYMLPFRCACCTELYKGLSNNNPEQYIKEEKETIKTKKKFKVKKKGNQ